MDMIADVVKRVDRGCLSAHLFHLASDPLPCRQLNVTLPGHEKNTLHEADDFIQNMLESWGYAVEREPVRVQAFRRDESKPVPQQFAPPDPADPWHDACNLHARKAGAERPNDVIICISHKDSQSWMDCAPGAYDNAVGTVGTMEIARVLADYQARRSLWFIWCNEEHWPWTSKTAAANIAASDANVVAVLNIDGIGHASQANRNAGRKGNVTRYVTPEGERIADLMIELNDRYSIGLTQTKYEAEQPNDDDGSFIKAGIPCAVMVNGSAPEKYPDYHCPTDTPDRVDVDNVAMAAQLCLATVVNIDGER